MRVICIYLTFESNAHTRPPPIMEPISNSIFQTHSKSGSSAYNQPLAACTYAFQNMSHYKICQASLKWKKDSAKGTASQKYNPRERMQSVAQSESYTRNLSLSAYIRSARAREIKARRFHGFRYLPYNLTTRGRTSSILDFSREEIDAQRKRGDTKSLKFHGFH